MRGLRGVRRRGRAGRLAATAAGEADHHHDGHHHNQGEHDHQTVTASPGPSLALSGEPPGANLLLVHAPTSVPTTKAKYRTTSNRASGRRIPPGRASAARVTSVAPISHASCSFPSRGDGGERDEQRWDDHAEPEVDRVAVERLANQRGAPAGDAEANRGHRVRDARERTEDQHAEDRVRDVPMGTEAQRRLNHAEAAGDDQRHVEEDQGEQVVCRVGARVRLAVDRRVLVKGLREALEMPATEPGSGDHDREIRDQRERGQDRRAGGREPAEEQRGRDQRHDQAHRALEQQRRAGKPYPSGDQRAQPDHRGEVEPVRADEHADPDVVGALE